MSFNQFDCCLKRTAIEWGQIDFVHWNWCQHNQLLILIFGFIAFITLSMLIPAFDDLDFFFTKWTVKWYLGHRKTVCKYSQMICLYWSLWNWQIYCLSEQNGSHFVDSKQTNYPQCIVVQLMSITNIIKFIHLVGSIDLNSN